MKFIWFNNDFIIFESVEFKVLFDYNLFSLDIYFPIFV